MNKVKRFISNNKEEMKVLAYGIAMFSAGLYLGKKYEGKVWDDSLIMLGDTGLNPKKIVGDKMYTISVVKETIK